MVIYNLDLVRMTALPPKADPPLVVDSNAVLALPVSFEELKPVARGHGHLPQLGGRVQGEKLPSCAPLNRRRKPAGEFTSEKPFGLCARKAQNHRDILTRCVNNVKRHIRSTCDGQPTCNGWISAGDKAWLQMGTSPESAATGTALVSLAGATQIGFHFSRLPIRVQQPCQHEARSRTR